MEKQCICFLKSIRGNWIVNEFILHFIGIVISTIGVTYMYYKLAEVKKSVKWYSYILLLIGILFLTWIKVNDIKSVSVISYFILYPILFYSMEYINLGRYIFYIFVIWIYGIFLDLSSMLVLALLYFIFKIDINNLIYLVVPSLYVGLSLIVLANCKWLKRFTNYLYKIFLKIKYADLMLFVFTIFTFVLGLILARNITNIRLGSIAFLCIILTFFVLLLLLKTKHNDMESATFLKALRDNNEFYIKMDDDNRLFRHNLKAKLNSIKSVSNKETAELIDDLIMQFAKAKKLDKHLRVIPYGFTSIIYNRTQEEINNLKIKVNNDVKFDIFDSISPRKYNVLSEKMGVALDNAIEASKRSKKKLLIINIYDENELLVVEIKNSFSEMVNMDNLGHKHYSTKSKSRGFGLYYILRNNEVKSDVKIVNDLFVCKLSTKIGKDN